MKIAVTGGGGFIGSPIERLGRAKGHEVFSFDRRDGNDVMGDLSGLAGAEAVIHLAGLLGTHELFDNVEEAINVNIVGSHRIMSWCMENDARYVGILMPDVFPSVYTATKVASHRLATALYHSRGLKCSHVRAYNVFGPGQAVGPGHPQKLVPTAAVAAWRNEPIPVWGDGLQKVDLIYVDDVASILLKATELIHNEVIEAGTGIPLTVNSVVQMIRNIAKSSSVVEHLPMRDGEIPTDIAASGDWELLGWTPQFRYADLIRTVDWYQS